MKLRTMLGADRPAVRYGWYVRVVVYLAILLLVAYVVNSMRGRIPMAFGLTPIRLTALSVEVMPSAPSQPADSSRTDAVVNVRIVGDRPLAKGVTLAQFHLVTKRSATFRPYASTLPFDSLGRLRIGVGDTLVGALLFALPRGEKPDQLWWRP